MRSVRALRHKLLLIVVALCAICLAPAAFAQNTPRFDPIQCPDLPKQLANARCGYLVVPGLSWTVVPAFGRMMRVISRS